MCAKLSKLSEFAEKIGVRSVENLTITFTSEEKAFLLWKIDEEVGRNKSVLQRVCSNNIKPKTRMKFERQWKFLQSLRSKLC